LCIISANWAGLVRNLRLEEPDYCPAGRLQCATTGTVVLRDFRGKNKEAIKRSVGFPSREDYRNIYKLLLL
jgi:hypothetical protein